mgnify:CR=1 FL=1|jgi:hypothetical protein
MRKRERRPPTGLCFPFLSLAPLLSSFDPLTSTPSFLILSLQPLLDNTLDAVIERIHVDGYYS